MALDCRSNDSWARDPILTTTLGCRTTSSDDNLPLSPHAAGTERR